MAEFRLLKMIMAKWEAAGKPMKQMFIWPSRIYYGDEPILIIVTKYALKLEKRVAELEAENQQLKEQIKELGDGTITMNEKCVKIRRMLQTRIAELKVERDELQEHRDALHLQLIEKSR